MFLIAEIESFLVRLTGTVLIGVLPLLAAMAMLWIVFRGRRK